MRRGEEISGASIAAARDSSRWCSKNPALYSQNTNRQVELLVRRRSILVDSGLDKSIKERFGSRCVPF